MNDRANSIMSIAFMLLCLGGMIIAYASVFDGAWYAIAMSPITAALIVMVHMLYGIPEK